MKNQDRWGDRLLRQDSISAICSVIGTDSSGTPVTRALQPIRTSQLTFRAKPPKTGRHVFLTSTATERNTTRFRITMPSIVPNVYDDAQSLMTRYSQNVTCICKKVLSVDHTLLECPITTELFQKDGYDFNGCNNRL